MSNAKPISQRIDDLVTRVEQNKARLSQLHARQSASTRSADTRRKILAGAAALTLAKTDSGFAEHLFTFIASYLTQKRDRILFDRISPDLKNSESRCEETRQPQAVTKITASGY